MSSLHPVRRLERFLLPHPFSAERPHLRVKWLSYHIPKTAGSSLRGSYQHAFGRWRVFGVYANTGAHAMSLGQPLWLPHFAKVLHGHFKPHPQHRGVFPHAKKIVWVRDPIERLWSLMTHLLEEGEKHPHYQILYKHCISQGITQQPDILERLIKDNLAPALTRTYARFFSRVPLNSFDFVGSVHNYSGAMNRLMEMMDCHLVIQERNVRARKGPPIPANVRALASYLDEEYGVVAPFL